MKKRSLLALLILLSPFLMANSPSPELYPDEYTDYELTNESIIISEEESTKYITFSGNLENTGDGIISFQDSSLYYVFESNNYEALYDYDNEIMPLQGLIPNQSYSFEGKFPYTGSAPLGAVTSTSRTVEIYGYQSDDIIQTIDVSNQMVTNVDYSESNDTTTFAYSFDWNNSGEVSAQTVFTFFTINNIEHVDYGWESIDKNATGHSNLYISLSGDVSTEELENINLFFIRRSYESYGWNFSKIFSVFGNLIIFGMVIISLIVLAPIIVITIVIVVVNRKK